MKHIMMDINEKYYLDLYFPESLNQKLPILYILDGNAFTNTIFEAVKLQNINSKKTKVTPMIIVGICYHNTKIFNKEERYKDFTPKKESVHDIPRFKYEIPEGGKINDFMDQLIFIHNVVISEIPVSINEKKIGIFGHSLGGLCVLETLICKEVSFITDFISISPSLWWDNLSYFKKIKNDSLPDLREKRLLIGVGSEECDMVDYSERAYSFFINNESLKSCSLNIAKKENHMSVVFTLISTFLRWFSDEESDING